MLLLCSLTRAFFALSFTSSAEAAHGTRSHGHDRKHSAPRLDARSLEPRAPPAGWRLHVAANNDGGGCYHDSGSPRVLGGWSGYVGTSSIERAVQECSSKGFNWVGVEYGNEIYCASALSTTLRSAPAGDCNSRCTSGETCGGAWRFNLYTKEPVSAWSLQGCFRDDSNRALKGHSFHDARMTVARCQSECRSRGFSLAGVEYGSECYCSNAHSAPRLADNQCDVRCSNGETNCGYVTSLFQINWIRRSSPFLTTSGAWSFSLYSFSAPAPGASPSASPTPTPTNALPQGWRYLHCVTDASNRALTGAGGYPVALTPPKCIAACIERGFGLAGVQDSNQCFCGNVLSNRASDAGRQVGENECSADCIGGEGKCGGPWRMNLYTNLQGAALSSALSGGTQTTTTITTTTTTQPAQPTTPPVTSFTPPSNFPSSSGEKQVFAHYIVGNAYAHNAATWRQEIGDAMGAGIDGFLLNLGRDDWQPSRVQEAYAVAQQMSFKMALSFDMTEMYCANQADAQNLRDWLSRYVSHPAAARFKGRAVVTTFGGQDCTFGLASPRQGWDSVMRGSGYSRDNVWFMPAFHVGVERLDQYDLDANVNWGSAWPFPGKEIETSRDEWYMQHLRPMGKGYVGTVSPVFATHLAYKNSIWRSDHMLMSVRWEQLLSMRNRLDQVQVISWNDWGESSYLSPVRGAMTPDTSDYVNNDFQHSDLLPLLAFYATAWKTGKYPAITRDTVWMMARPHPANAKAAGGWGQPQNYDLSTPGGRRIDSQSLTTQTDDNFYTQIHLVAPASITLCSGSSNNCATREGVAGINRFPHPLVVGQRASVRVERAGKVVAAVEAPMAFNGSPARYNFNYWVKASS